MALRRITHNGIFSSFFLLIQANIHIQHLSFTLVQANRKTNETYKIYVAVYTR